MLPPSYEPDNDEIVKNLKILLSVCQVDFLQLLPLFQQPGLNAVVDLLLRVGRGLDPGYLVRAASVLGPTSNVPESTPSELSSRVVSLTSSDSGISRLSGTTFGGFDTPVSFKRLNLWQDVPIASDPAFAAPSPTTPSIQVQLPQQLSSKFNHDFVFDDGFDLNDSALPHNGSIHDYSFASDNSTSLPYVERGRGDSETQYRIDTGTFLSTESEDLQREPVLVQPEQYSYDTMSTSLTPAYSTPFSPGEEGLTPTSSDVTSRSPNAEYSQNPDTAIQPFHSKLPTRISKQPTTAAHSVEFQPYNFSKPIAKKNRSPCPYCGDNFESQSELIFHIEANHEKPITYVCQHLDAKLKICGFSTTRKSRWTRHHSKKHSEAECNMPETCRQEITAAHPKRNWGCGWCPHHSTSLKSWAEHHMNKNLKTHQNCRRLQWNSSMLIKSLLMQEATKLSWEQVVQNLENSTEYEYEITWSPENTEMKRLITALETGWYQDQDLNQDEGLQQGLVMELMDQAIKKKSRPITPSNKRAATSSPQGSRVNESRPRRALQHQSSGSALNRTLVPGYGEAIQADVDTGNVFYKRAVQRQDPKSK